MHCPNYRRLVNSEVKSRLSNDIFPHVKAHASHKETAELWVRARPEGRRESEVAGIVLLLIPQVALILQTLASRQSRSNEPLPALLVALSHMSEWLVPHIITWHFHTFKGYIQQWETVTEMLQLRFNDMSFHETLLPLTARARRGNMLYVWRQSRRGQHLQWADCCCNDYILPKSKNKSNSYPLSKLHKGSICVDTGASAPAFRNPQQRQRNRI